MPSIRGVSKMASKMVSKGRERLSLIACVYAVHLYPISFTYAQSAALHGPEDKVESHCQEDGDCDVVIEDGQEPKCVSVTCDTSTGQCVPVIKSGLIIDYNQQKAGECYAEPLVCDPQGKSVLDTDPSKRVEANEGGTCTQPAGAEPPTVCQKAVCAKKQCVVRPDSSAVGKGCGDPKTVDCKRTTYECSGDGRCGELVSIAPGAECAPDGTLAPKDRLPKSFAALYTSLPKPPFYTCDRADCKVRYCGDGTVNNDEECDGTARAAGVPAEAFCDSNTCLASFCGDGVISGGETCDKKADGTLIFKAGNDPKSTCDMQTCTVPACSGATSAGWIRCDLQPPLQNLTYALTRDGSKAACEPGKCLAFCDEVSGYILKDGVCKKESPDPIAIPLENDEYGAWGFEEEVQPWESWKCGVTDTCDVTGTFQEYTCPLIDYHSARWCRDVYCSSRLEVVYEQICLDWGCISNPSFVTKTFYKERQVKCVGEPLDTCNFDSESLYTCPNEDKRCVDIFIGGLTYVGNVGAYLGQQPPQWFFTQTFQKWGREVTCTKR